MRKSGKSREPIDAQHRTRKTEHADVDVRPTSGVVWSEGEVTQADREKLTGNRGRVLWFTGLSGSGKSTIAIAVEKTLIDQGHLCYRLDGDNLRHGLNRDLGFLPDDRRENIRRVAEVAALFSDAGIITLVSFISPYRDMRAFARERIGSDRFLEIYVKAEVDICRSRDPKGLYQKADAGEISDFTGVDAPYEEPEDPELIVDTEKQSVEESVKQILELLHVKS